MRIQVFLMVVLAMVVRAMEIELSSTAPFRYNEAIGLFDHGDAREALKMVVEGLSTCHEGHILERLVEPLVPKIHKILALAHQEETRVYAVRALKFLMAARPEVLGPALSPDLFGVLDGACADGRAEVRHEAVLALGNLAASCEQFKGMLLGAGIMGRVQGLLETETDFLVLDQIIWTFETLVNGQSLDKYLASLSALIKRLRPEDNARILPIYRTILCILKDLSMTDPNVSRFLLTIPGLFYRLLMLSALEPTSCLFLVGSMVEVCDGPQAIAEMMEAGVLEFLAVHAKSLFDTTSQTEAIRTISKIVIEAPHSILQIIAHPTLVPSIMDALTSETVGLANEAAFAIQQLRPGLPIELLIKVAFPRNMLYYLDNASSIDVDLVGPLLQLLLDCVRVAGRDTIIEAVRSWSFDTGSSPDQLMTRLSKIPALSELVEQLRKFA